MIIVLIFIAISIVLYTYLTGISPMPSSRKAKKAILKLIEKYPHETVYELGAGWGTLLVPMIKQFPKSQVIAYELSPFPWLITRLRTLGKKVVVYRRNFFKSQIVDAKCVVCYLYPGAMKKLGPKLEQELDSGSVVVTNTFSLPDWRPKEVITLDDIYKTKIYIYQK